MQITSDTNFIYLFRWIVGHFLFPPLSLSLSSSALFPLSLTHTNSVWMPVPLIDVMLCRFARNPKFLCDAFLDPFFLHSDLHLGNFFIDTPMRVVALCTLALAYKFYRHNTTLFDKMWRTNSLVTRVDWWVMGEGHQCDNATGTCAALSWKRDKILQSCYLEKYWHW